MTILPQVHRSPILVMYRSRRTGTRSDIDFTFATSLPMPLLPPVTRQCLPCIFILPFVPRSNRRRHPSTSSVVAPPMTAAQTVVVRYPPSRDRPSMATRAARSELASAVLLAVEESSTRTYGSSTRYLVVNREYIVPIRDALCCKRL